MIIGAGWEQIPLIDNAKKMGYYVIATTQWSVNQLNADVVYKVDSRNIEELEKIYNCELPDAITSDECDYSMYAVAYLTTKHNLPGPQLETLTITNNKYLQRKILVDKGLTSIKQPEFSLCWNYEQAVSEAEKIGYPVIIKPLDNRGSIGVIKVSNKESIKNAWLTAVVNSHSRMCIIEKYIEGDTITVEGFFDSKQFNFITVSSKDTYKDNKNVAKILYYPGKLSQSQIGLVKNYSENIVKAYGINFGFTHFEFLIEENTDNIYFVEAANRGGGVFISNVILKSITGYNFTESLIRMSLGEKVLIKSLELKKKAIMYFFSPLGKELPEQISNSNILAMHINATKNKEMGSTDDARSREGVVILEGDKFEKLLVDAADIEHRIKALDTEYVHVF